MLDFIPTFGTRQVDGARIETVASFGTNDECRHIGPLRTIVALVTGTRRCCQVHLAAVIACTNNRGMFFNAYNVNSKCLDILSKGDNTEWRSAGNLAEFLANVDKVKIGSLALFEYE